MKSSESTRHSHAALPKGAAPSVLPESPKRMAPVAPSYDGRAPRLWEIGEGRGTKDAFPFSDHRTQAQVIIDDAPTHLRHLVRTRIEFHCAGKNLRGVAFK